tara:strand:+ start:204 stop:575 length:372 start_codon:yes stop_codon:yes gene_type:complete
MEGYEALLYFICGAFSYKIISHLLHLGTAVNIYNETIKNCVGMLKVSDEIRKSSNEIKYTLLESQGVPTLEIASMKEADADIAKFWRLAALESFKSMLPSFISEKLLFKNWEDMSRIVEKEIK